MYKDKINTNVTLERELRDKAKKHGLSMSKVLQNALTEIIAKLEN